MQIIDTPLEGLKHIIPTCFPDARGFFFESFQEKRYQAHLHYNKPFVQDNISHSVQNTLRGLHFQTKNPQAKLVSVISGSIFDVAVDIRANSPTFGQYFGIELSGENHHQLFIPEGFAHGFYVTSCYADVHYKCTDYYDPKNEAGILWSDPDIKIEWPLIGKPLLSEKDAQYSALTKHNLR